MPPLGRRRTVALLLLTLLAFNLASCEGGLRRRLLSAYKGLAEAEREGADVTGAALKLNRALKLIEEGERTGNSTALRTAEELIAEVEAELPSLVEEGRARARARLAWLAAAASATCAAGALAYLYAPRLVWGLWLRARRRWRVRRVAR